MCSISEVPHENCVGRFECKMEIGIVNGLEQ
jgi:hypothetical protein